MTIRTVIAEDEPLARQTLRDFAEESDWVSVVGEVADGQATVEMVNELRPDLLFLDVQMPELSGIQVLEAAEVRQILKYVGETLGWNSGSGTTTKGWLFHGEQDVTVGVPVGWAALPGNPGRAAWWLAGFDQLKSVRFTEIEGVSRPPSGGPRLAAGPKTALTGSES